MALTRAKFLNSNLKTWRILVKVFLSEVEL